MAEKVENADISMYAPAHQLYFRWYRNNYLLVNPGKYESLVINPRCLDISVGALDIKKEGKLKSLKMLTRSSY